MKKIIAILFTAFLLTMCGTSKSAKADSKPQVQYVDNFKPASDKEKTAFLKKLNATEANYSVLILTKNFKGEQITVTNGEKVVYKEYPISNVKTRLAGELRIDNSLDTKVYDALTKKEATIPSKQAKNYKYVYLMKKPGADNPFLITYSNTLRPME